MTLSKWASAALCCVLVTAGHRALAQEDITANVQLPLSRWQALVQGGREPSAASYAFSDVAVDVQVGDDGESAEVTVSVTVRVIGTGWALVPLAAGGPLASATADDTNADLVASPGGLAWPIEQTTAGAAPHHLTWHYRADARRWGEGRVLSLPTPPS